MSENDEFDLLSDIAKLIKKHNLESFERLANQLSNPEFVLHLTKIVSVAAKVSRDISFAKKGNNKSPKKDFRSSLIEIVELDAVKGNLLLNLYEGLLSKTLLPTLREVRAFTQDNGFPDIKAKSREKAIISLMKFLVSLSSEEIESHLSKIQPSTNLNDRSLEAWSKIILNPRKALNKL